MLRPFIPEEYHCTLIDPSKVGQDKGQTEMANTFVI